MPKLLSIGECMIELAPTPADTFSMGFAGDTFNTAWYLAQIAPTVEVSYLTALGDDRMSEDMRDFMGASGIKADHVQRIAGKTVGLYVIHLADGERSFSYWRGQSAARDLAKDPGVLAAAMGGADLIYLSGITLAILDPASRARVFGALAAARGTGKRVAFDPNLRPRLWESTGEMTETVSEAAALADIVLPSFDDEAAWFGDTSPDATLDRYAQAGPRQVVVKNAASSVVFLDGAERGSVEVAPIADVVDTTAAGDSFNAGVLAALLRGFALRHGITEGCHLARHVVQHSGALVPVG